jgi:hypothetical protein
MALAEWPILYTTEEYPGLEREATERHECLDGYMYLMAGQSLEHSTDWLKHQRGAGTLERLDSDT